MQETEEAGRVDPEAGRPSAARLFLAFLRLGLTAFGGPAMVAYIGRLAVERRQWLTKESFESGVALCQSIPGATAMQTAAYVGLRAGGPRGALAAFAGFGLPAFSLMLALSAVYREGRDLQPVVLAFRGLQVIVVALVANAALNFGRSSIKNWRDAFLAAGAAGVIVGHGSPILVIVAAAAIALLLYRGVALPEGRGHAAGGDGVRRSLLGAIVLTASAVAGLVALFLLDRALFALAALMMQVDIFAFGGGFASVPLMLHEVVNVRQWLDGKTFMDGIALGQVTPGPIVITATFVGYQVAGLPGAIVGTLGIFTPSLFIVLLTLPYFDRLRQSLLFRRAVRGVLATFVGLLLAVAVNFALVISWTIPSVILTAAAFAALRLKIDVLWVVLVGAVVSILIL